MPLSSQITTITRMPTISEPEPNEPGSSRRKPSCPRRKKSSKSGARAHPPHPPPPDEGGGPQGPCGPPAPLLSPPDELVQGIRPLIPSLRQGLGKRRLGVYMCIAAGAQTR